MRKSCFPSLFIRILLPAHLFCFIFTVSLIYTQEVYGFQSSYAGEEKTNHELFFDRSMSDFSVNPESVLTYRNGNTSQPSLFYYFGTDRGFSSRTDYRLMFSSGKNTFSSSDSPIIPILSIKGTLHPGATKMGLSLLSLLHMPFFQTSRFGLGQK